MCFFKHKTAYEMRISDWSSDVCSSDLIRILTMPAKKDRITLPPKNAERTNMTCHFCIVGCGYHVYKWPEQKEGGRAPEDNALGLDLDRKSVVKGKSV